MSNPSNLKYTKSHEWVEFAGGSTVKVGLTDFAQNELGDIVFVNLPAIGDELTVGESLGDVESVKAVSDIYAPCSGVVTAVNEALLDAPEIMNKSPYDAWLIEFSDITDQEALLSADEYEVFCKEEA